MARRDSASTTTERASETFVRRHHALQARFSPSAHVASHLLFSFLSSACAAARGYGPGISSAVTTLARYGGAWTYHVGGAAGAHALRFARLERASQLRSADHRRGNSPGQPRLPHGDNRAESSCAKARQRNHASPQRRDQSGVCEQEWENRDNCQPASRHFRNTALAGQELSA